MPRDLEHAVSTLEISVLDPGLEAAVTCLPSNSQPVIKQASHSNSLSAELLLSATV